MKLFILLEALRIENYKDFQKFVPSIFISPTFSGAFYDIILTPAGFCFYRINHWAAPLDLLMIRPNTVSIMLLINFL